MKAALYIVLLIPGPVAAASDLAEAHRIHGRYDEAERECRRAMAILQAQPESNKVALASLRNTLANIRLDQNRPEEAEAIIREALADLSPEDDDALTAALTSSLGASCQAQGRLSEARSLFERALAVRKRLFGSEQPQTADSLNDLGTVLYDLGDYAAAQALLEHALRIRQTSLSASHPAVVQSFNNLGQVYVRLLRYKDAEHSFREALTVHHRVFGTTHPQYGVYLTNLGTLYQSQRRYDLAESTLRQALTALERRFGRDHPSTLTTLISLAGVAITLQNTKEGERYCLRAMAIVENMAKPNPRSLAYVHNHLGFIRRMQKRDHEAAAHYRKALALLESALGPKHQDVEIVSRNLADLRDR